MDNKLVYLGDGVYIAPHRITDVTTDEEAVVLFFGDHTRAIYRHEHEEAYHNIMALLQEGVISDTELYQRAMTLSGQAQ